MIAEHLPGEDAYEVAANFQGPLAMHPVMALALGVPGNRLRLKTPPDSGGSFGAKHAVFPYVVVMALAARKAGRPVKWVETRLEHLTAATSATNRVTTLTAAVDEHGVITALDWDQLEDCGAYLRAPEPATLYRMHGNMTGAYRVPNLAIRNRVVMTNKTPSGLVRGFGGPQVYFALERLIQKIAVTLGLDPLDVIRRNLVDRFPYRCPAGAVLDSGDYHAAVEQAVSEGGLDALYRRREEARAAGRLYGIGFAAIVEPSISNMGYITTVLTPKERARAGPKGGAQAAAAVALDSLGGISVIIDSLPQGQGHRTVTAQAVGDVFGLPGSATGRRGLFPTAMPRRCGRPCLRRHKPGKRLEFYPSCRDRPLVAGVSSRRRCRAAARNRVLEPGGAAAAERGRRDQQLGNLRLCVRFLRHRDRPRYGRSMRRPLCQPARCRPHSERGIIRRPGARRFCDGDRRRPL
ncbi:MAG: hypothetical protein AUG92_02085 [Alphaproteobacteria bacterium 13_1_20CM_4_65_11]|nr:MAG: hypothetical protein AUG92_02085 [Alphaproteobacteria bacterium 13_1_20CM_4_65_11]